MASGLATIFFARFLYEVLLHRRPQATIYIAEFVVTRCFFVIILWGMQIAVEALRLNLPGLPHVERPNQVKNFRTHCLCRAAHESEFIWLRGRIARRCIRHHTSLPDATDSVRDITWQRRDGLGAEFLHIGNILDNDGKHDSKRRGFFSAANSRRRRSHRLNKHQRQHCDLYAGNQPDGQHAIHCDNLRCRNRRGGQCVGGRLQLAVHHWRGP